jgi:hypothetical protein
MSAFESLSRMSAIVASHLFSTDAPVLSHQRFKADKNLLHLFVVLLVTNDD